MSRIVIGLTAVALAIGGIVSIPQPADACGILEAVLIGCKSKQPADDGGIVRKDRDEDLFDRCETVAHTSDWETRQGYVHILPVRLAQRNRNLVEIEQPRGYNVSIRPDEGFYLSDTPKVRLRSCGA